EAPGARRGPRRRGAGESHKPAIKPVHFHRAARFSLRDAAAGGAMRRLTLSGLLLLIATGAAMACSSIEPVSDERSFANASAVFVGHVLRTEETQSPDPQPADHATTRMVEATVRTIEVLKGQPPADGKVRSLVYGPGNCSVALLAGVDY